MSGVLAGLAAGAADGVVSSGFGFLANKQQQEYYEKNQQKAFEYGQQEQINRARNARTGLLLAGMSPALAQDGKFAPASAPSSPLGSPAFPTIHVAESMLAMAQAKKAEAEAKDIEIDVENKLDASETAAFNLQRFFEKKAAEAEAAGDSENAAYYTDLAGREGSMGALAALHDYLNLENKDAEYELRKREYEFSGYVVDEQIKRGIFKDVAQLPRTERRKVAKEIEHLTHVIKNVDMDTLHTEKDINLTEAEIERVKYLARQINNSDINSMIADGRYGQAAAVIATHWIDSSGENAIEAAKTIATKKVPTKIQSVK